MQIDLPAEKIKDCIVDMYMDRSDKVSFIVRLIENDHWSDEIVMDLQRYFNERDIR